MTDCAVSKTANIVGKRWSLNIMLELHKANKPIRYSELKRRIKKITPKMLSQRLVDLNSYRLLKKRISSKTIPIKCEYTLTESGKDFIKIIKKMKKWATLHQNVRPQCKSTNCRHCHF